MIWDEEDQSLCERMNSRADTSLSGERDTELDMGRQFRLRGQTQPRGLPRDGQRNRERPLLQRARHEVEWRTGRRRMSYVTSSVL